MATDDNAELVFCRKACANYNAHGRGSPVSPSATSNWQSSVSIEDSPVIAAAAAAAVSSCGSSSPESLLGVNWHRHHQRPSVDQSVCFQASLSSMVPLPPTPVAAAAAACENILFRELMGRLGTARPPGGGPLLPPPAASSWKLKPSLINSSSNLMTSGVDPSKAGLPLENTGTRLCPSPAHNLAHFSTDPGFAERAARFSSFSAKNLSDLGGPAFSFTDAGHSDTHLQPHAALSFRSAAAIAIDKIPRVHNSPSLNAAAAASCEQQAAAQQPHKEEEQEGSETDKKEAAKQRSRNASASTSPACTEDTNMKLKLQNESDDAELSSAHKESQSQSPCTDQTASPAMAALTLNEISANKRKVPSSTIYQKDTPPASDDKVREAEYSHLQVKRSKMSSEAAAVTSDKDEAKPKAEKSNAKQIKENFKAPEPPKDYIHVRARRGQATDSHSLAERVRREKISERMKFLQDLVPGCSKVTGKAVMLDEIINYVQSLQKQVEFLSMKLATVNPRLDVNMDGLIAKEMLHPHGHGASSRMLLHTDNTTAFPELPLSSQGSTDVQVSMSCATEGHGMHNSVEAALPNANAINVQMPCVDGFADPMSQVANIWDDDLHTVVQMGYNQNQQIPFTSQGYHGQLPTNHMKIEL